MPHQSSPQQPTASIYLAGGCFWCTEAIFRRVRGVQHVRSGYANGTDIATPPTYAAVCTGTTGYAEAVEVVYAPQELALVDLLAIFFATHDPTTLNRQGNDVGTQYRSGIYFHTPQQQQVAQAMLEQLAQERVFDAPLTTELLPEQNFWPAEDYHAQYYARNPSQGYCAAIIGPKLAKFRQTFTQFLKP